MKRQLLFLIILTYGQTFSQDIIGGHTRTKLVTGFSYSISITLFTDASKNINRPTIPVDFGDSNTGTFNLSGTSTSNGINVQTYSGLHTYAGPGQYLVSYIGNYRVAGIKNMVSSQAQQICSGSVIKISSFIAANTSPAISFYPLSNSVGMNQLFQYNFGVSDADGDSLSYFLISSCGVGYYIPTNAGVNNFSGTFNFSKDTIGQYAFALQINEWRKDSSNSYIFIGSSQMDFVVGISNNVAVSELTSNKVDIFLYPNPAHNELHISHKKVLDETYYIEILNALSQLVLKTKYSDEINISSLSKGIYMLRLSSKNIITDAFRFVKE